MNLIQILIEKKEKIEHLEQEVEGLRKELEHLYFTNFRGLKNWKRANTILCSKIRKVIYVPRMKLKGNKKLLYLNRQKAQLIELIEEAKNQIEEIEIENMSKIG